MSSEVNYQNPEENKGGPHSNGEEFTGGVGSVKLGGRRSRRRTRSRSRRGGSKLSHGGKRTRRYRRGGNIDVSKLLGGKRRKGSRRRSSRRRFR